MLSLDDLDEAIAHAREKAKEIRENIIDGDNLEPYESYCNAMVVKNAKEHEQLAEWLEELKAYQQQHIALCEKYCVNTIEDLYVKAIDDFVKFANTMPTVEEEDGTIRPMWLEEMAEKLKAGGKNE